MSAHQPALGSQKVQQTSPSHSGMPCIRHSTLERLLAQMLLRGMPQVRPSVIVLPDLHVSIYHRWLLLHSIQVGQDGAELVTS
jgi:hypothetical protein